MGCGFGDDASAGGDDAAGEHEIVVHLERLDRHAVGILMPAGCPHPYQAAADVGGKHTNQAMPRTDGAFVGADLAGVEEEDLGSSEVDVPAHGAIEPEFGCGSAAWPQGPVMRAASSASGVERSEQRMRAYTSQATCAALASTRKVRC